VTQYIYIFGGTAYMFRIKYNGRSLKINKSFCSDGIVPIDTLLTPIYWRVGGIC